jgi:signal transduction histidine kinase
MRVKAFLISYVVFLLVLFGMVSTVSIYMTRHQTTILREQKTRQFQAIATSLARDIDALERRGEGGARASLIASMVRFYEAHNISLVITELEFGYDSPYKRIYFTQVNGEHTIHIVEMFRGNLQMEAGFDITEDILDMQNIQQMLLVFVIIFSLVGAVALYAILDKVFKPLQMIAKASRKIAYGKYTERITLKGKNNELSSMAEDFNRMAEEIEDKIWQLEEETIRKQQFIDNFAHEIRTPLTSIYGFAEYMQKTKLTEENKVEFTNYIMNDSKHMKAIADSMLELATLRNFKPTKEEVSVEELFTEVSKTLESTLRSRKVELILKPIEGVIFGQRDLLKSLLLNCLANGIKACTEKDGVVTLEAVKENNQLIILISDNGCGIAPEDLGKVIEPFYRVDKARTRKGSSVGLGLPLAKQIVQIHQGRMEIASKVEVGTTIRITFTSP